MCSEISLSIEVDIIFVCETESFQKWSDYHLEEEFGKVSHHL